MLNLFLEKEVRKQISSNSKNYLYLTLSKLMLLREESIATEVATNMVGLLGTLTGKK